jgi:death-on-curing protein
LPSDHVQFLRLDEAPAVDALFVARFAGIAGVRDTGLLDSALRLPRTGYHDDIPAMAAALMDSLLINHPFGDGNKRVAFFATDVFLRLNGWKLEIDDSDAHDFLVGLLERHEVGGDALETWLLA